MVITLIGYRGCGKSTVGPLLAERFGLSCVDSDDQVQKNAGMSIARIFAEHGEERFRDLESGALESLASRDDVVIAAGGGAILRPQNRQLLKAAGHVVWLNVTADVLAARITSDASSAATRPSLTGQSIADEVAEVLTERLPLYEDAATLTVDVSEQSPQQVAENIAGILSTAEDQ